MMNNSNTIFEKLSELRILPVIKISDERDALPLADALIRGGLPAAEHSTQMRRQCDCSD